MLSEASTFRRLSRAETVEFEPALAPIANHLNGRDSYGTDETGDAYRFCVALADTLDSEALNFAFAPTVSSLETRSGRVTTAIECAERFVADRYIVSRAVTARRSCAASVCICRCGPAKGYSITFDRHRVGSY